MCSELSTQVYVHILILTLKKTGLQLLLEREHIMSCENVEKLTQIPANQMSDASELTRCLGLCILVFMWTELLMFDNELTFQNENFYSVGNTSLHRNYHTFVYSLNVITEVTFFKCLTPAICQTIEVSSLIENCRMRK